MLRLRSLFALVFALSLIGPAPSVAQFTVPDSALHAADALSPRPSAPHVTLDGWLTRRRRMLLDQHHAFGGRTYDRGAFRHITPGMDREYAIDMANYRFSPFESVTWRRLDSGFRQRGGSIVRAEWAFVSEIKHTAKLDDKNTLRFDATLQQDATAQRSHLEISYDWQIDGPHHAGIRHTFSQYKPDFDPSLYYQYGSSPYGRARVELTFLNAYHDLIFKTLGVSAKDEPIVEDYEQRPYLGRIALETPARFSLRAELHAAWQPESELVIQSQRDSDYRYRDQEATHFLGALIEYNAGPVTGGLMFQRDKSSLDRLGLQPAVTSDYSTTQRFQRGGAFLLGTWGPFVGEAWFFLEDYYDRQEGEDFSLSTISRSMNYTEYRKHYRLRLAYSPSPTGFYGSVEYMAMSRRLGPQPWIMGNEWTNHWYQLAPSNYRVSNVIGYRFGRGAVELGINYDLDGDGHYKAGPEYKKKRFDNGYVRFVTSW